MLAENPRAVAGHNEPPLAESLAEETAALKERADALAAAAGRAAVTDEDSSARATALGKMIRDHIKLVDDTRVERKAPYLESCRTVDTHFNAIAGTLAVTDSKGKVTGGPLHSVVNMLDAYRRKKDEEAAAERRRLEEAARQARLAQEAAERAQRKAEERERREREAAEQRIRDAEAAAKRAGDRAAAEKAARERAEADAARRAQESADRERRMQQEIEANRAAEEARALEAKAAATVAAPMGGYGAKASGRKVYTATIIDLTAAIKHCRKVDEPTLKAAVQSIYDRQIKAGVRTLPGADVTEDTITTIR